MKKTRIIDEFSKQELQIIRIAIAKHSHPEAEKIYKKLLKFTSLKTK